MGTSNISGHIAKGPDGLTDKMRRFCEEYVKDYNAGQAYKRASDTVTTMDSARNVASKLLKKPEIIAYINKLQKQLLEAQCVNAERIAQTLSDIAFDEKASKSDRLRALALLQKQYGLDQVKVTADVNQTIDIKVGVVDDNDKPSD